MVDSPPPELTRLLDRHAPDRGAAWEAFIAVHHRLLLHVVRSFTRDRDAAMDAFAWILDRLREEDHRRLRSFRADGRSEFTTWLVVVARRLCLDWHRGKYGRERPTAASAHRAEVRSARRRLVDLIGETVDATELADRDHTGPEAELRAAELSDALHNALGELDPSDRLLLKLRFDDGLSAADIADLMRMPTPFHVYRRLSTLLESLRKALRTRGVEGPTP